MSNSPPDDPLVRDELIRISLETYEVHFKFNRSTVQVGAPFFLKRSDEILAEIDPERRSGDAKELWQLVGMTVKAVIWTESVCIIFSNDLELFIPPSTGGLRGMILRGDMPAWTFDEF